MSRPTLYLSRQQLRQVDALAIQQYHIPGIVLMENAARAVTDAALAMLGAGEGSAGGAGGTGVLILCGGGNNGGDGLAAARHLHNRGIAVQIGLTMQASRFGGDALVNWQIAQAMGLLAEPATPQLVAQKPWSLIVDAVFGTGLSQSPAEPFPALAWAVSGSGIPVLAVDLPSGLDCDSGRPPGACIRATRTITLAAMKLGFAQAESRQWTGPVLLGDIGCPAQLIRDIAEAAHAD